MSGTNLYVIRHGQTDWNLLHRMQGHTDVPLDETGRRQAELVAERFRGFPVKALYTSDLKRATETAAPLAEALGVEPVLRADLREAHFGDWEGLTREEMERDYPDEYGAYKIDPVPCRPPGGEAMREMIARIVGAAERIVSEASGGNVVIVTHGGPARGLAMDALAGTSQTFQRLRTDNTGVSLVQFEPGGRRWLALWNDTTHLGGPDTSDRLMDALLKGRY